MTWINCAKYQPHYHHNLSNVKKHPEICVMFQTHVCVPTQQLQGKWLKYLNTIWLKLNEINYYDGVWFYKRLILKQSQTCQYECAVDWWFSLEFATNIFLPHTTTCLTMKVVFWMTAAHHCTYISLRWTTEKGVCSLSDSEINHNDDVTDSSADHAAVWTSRWKVQSFFYHHFSAYCNTLDSVF